MSEYDYSEQKAIGARLKSRIKALGLTRAQVAERTSVSVATIRLVVNGNQFPTGAQINHLCKGLDMSPNYLLWGSEIAENKSPLEKMRDGVKVGLMLQFMDADERVAIERLIKSTLANKTPSDKYRTILEEMEKVNAQNAAEFVKGVLEHV